MNEKYILGVDPATGEDKTVIAIYSMTSKPNHDDLIDAIMLTFAYEKPLTFWQRIKRGFKRLLNRGIANVQDFKRSHKP